MFLQHSRECNCKKWLIIFSKKAFRIFDFNFNGKRNLINLRAQKCPCCCAQNKHLSTSSWTLPRVTKSQSNACYKNYIILCNLQQSESITKNQLRVSMARMANIFSCIYYLFAFVNTVKFGWLKKINVHKTQHARKLEKFY